MPRRFHELIDGIDDLPELGRFVPSFELLIDDLTTVDDATLQRRPLRAFPKITLWLLRDGREIGELLDHLSAWAAELEQLVREDPDRDDVLTVLRYIWRVAGDVAYETLRDRIADVAPTFEETMASVEQQLIEIGREQGREQGVQRTLARQLRLRFGDLSAADEARLANATPAELERWTERVLVAQRLDDVFDASDPAPEPS